jgi:hypothetical protein
MGNENYSPYDCAVINDELTRESGRISGEIYSRLREVSPWIRLIKAGEFPMGMGNIIQNLTFERTFSADNTWENVSTSDGSDASACLPPVEDVAFGQTQRNFRLQHIAKEGPDLCINDLRTTYQVTQQMSKVMDALTDLTGWIWENRYRDEYHRLSGNKVLARPNLPISNGEDWLAGQEPTSKLTQGILDRVYLKLIRDGAGREGALARSNGRPIFGLITSAEASNDIIFADDSVRDDLKWANPDWNLAPLGVDRSYRGFAHIVDPYPARWNNVGGVMTKVEPWLSSSTTKGNKFEIDPDYETAEFEESYVFLPTVYKCLKPRPMSSAGGNTRFDPQSFMGDFNWKNIPDRKCNPDGTIGFHRAVFIAASEPVHPEQGYVILHKRCNADLNLQDCTYS